MCETMTVNEISTQLSKGLRSFRIEWTQTYKWLIYDNKKMRAFRKICKEAKDKQLIDKERYVF